jgi:IrrE N-terminal-like domain
LRIAELPDGAGQLTYRTATEFLSRETKQALPSLEGDDKPLSGFLYAYEYGGYFYGCVLTERRDPTPRRRYSAAHEMGHYLLHFLPLLEEQERGNKHESLVLVEGVSFDKQSEENDEEFPTGKLTVAVGTEMKWRHARYDTAEMEREADMFAAELLMPAHVCRALVKPYVSRFGNKKSVIPRKLATEFLVSYEAMKRRLIDLGLYDER